MKITKRSPLTGKEHTMDLPITQEQLDRWEAGELVQQVFDDLSDSQREFLISGIYEDEWNMLGFDNDDSIDDNMVFTDEDMAYINELEKASEVDQAAENVGDSVFGVMYQIRFKDIDPDTGYVSQDACVAYAEDAKKAEWVKAALQHYTGDIETDPNREIYILKKSTL